MSEGYDRLFLKGNKYKGKRKDIIPQRNIFKVLIEVSGEMC